MNEWMNKNKKKLLTYNGDDKAPLKRGWETQKEFCCCTSNKIVSFFFWLFYFPAVRGVFCFLFFVFFACFFCFDLFPSAGSRCIGWFHLRTRLGVELAGWVRHGRWHSSCMCMIWCVYTCVKVFSTWVCNDLQQLILVCARFHTSFCGLRWRHFSIHFYFELEVYLFLIFIFCVQHELGHGLRLGHSMYGGNEYGDSTAIMGGVWICSSASAYFFFLSKLSLMMLYFFLLGWKSIVP